MARLEVLQKGEVLVAADLGEMIEGLFEQYPSGSWNSNIDPERMTVEAEGIGGRLRVVIGALSVERLPAGKVIEAFRADVFVDLF